MTQRDARRAGRSPESGDDLRVPARAAEHVALDDRALRELDAVWTAV
ncbi:MAG TPA: hypothetical protein VMC03_15355 [Streptosporangiaceae bacterium]|nr:hypothetical protein [Streptosporangiaceae bacterium]